MAVRTVGTNAEFVAAYNASAPGDVIQILDDNVITGYVHANGRPGVTIRGQTARVAPLPRIVVQNAPNTTIADLKIQMANYDPSPYGALPQNRGPDLISTQQNTDNLLIQNNIIRCGNYEDGRRPFDPSNTEKYLAYVGDIARGIAPTKTPAYPRLIGHLAADGTTNGSMNGSLTVKGNLLEDTGGDAIKFGHLGGGASIIITENIIQRVYQDFISVGLPGGQPGPFSRFEVTKNIFWDPFNQTQDYGAHGDILQVFSLDQGGTRIYFASAPTPLPVVGDTVTFPCYLKDPLDGLYKPGGTTSRPIQIIGTDTTGWYVDFSNGSWFTNVSTGNCTFSNGASKVSTKVTTPRPGPNDTRSPWDNLIVARNIVGMSAGCRGQKQDIFGSDVPPGAPFRGAYIGQNVLLRRVGGNCIILSNDAIAGAAHCMVDRNLGISHAILNQVLAGQNESFAHANQNAASLSPSRIAVFRDTVYTGQNLVSRNVIEAITPQLGQDTATYPNYVTAMHTPTTQAAAAAVYDIDWSDTYTPEGIIRQLQPKAGMEHLGPVRPGMDLAAFLTFGPSDYADIPSYVGFQPVTGAAASATVTSDWAMVQAGFQTRAWSCTHEVQFCDNYDPYLGGAQSPGPWLPAGSSGTVAHGKWVRVRRAASPIPAVQVQVKFTLGGQESVWRLTTLDTTNFPHVTFDATQIVSQVSAGGLKSVTTNVCTYAFEFTFDKPLVATQIIGQSAGVAQVSTQATLTNGVGYFKLFGIAGNVSIPILNATPGQKHHVIITFDNSKATKEEGIKVAVDFARISNATLGSSWDNTPRSFAALPSTKIQLGGSGTNPVLSGTVGLVAIWPGYLADLDSQAEIDRFRAAYIGPNGEGPFGVKPPLMLTGKADTWNAGNPNRGDGQAWAKTTGNPITNADVNPWPPNLYTVAEVLAPGTRPVGAPTTIRVSALGFPKLVNFAPQSDRAGTWNRVSAPLSLERDGYADFEFTPLAAGTHTFSFTNDGGYNNPPPVTLLADNGVPAADPTTFSLEVSAASFEAGGMVTLTCTLDEVATSAVTITLSDGAAPGTFSAATVVIPIGSISGSLTYTSATAGAVTISATNNRGLTNPSSVGVTVTSAAPSSFTMEASTTTPLQGSAVTLTFTLNRVATQDVIIAPADGVAPGGFSASTVTILAGQAVGSLTYTPTAAGEVTLSASNNRGLANPSPLNLTVGAFDPPASISLQIDSPLVRLGRGTPVRFMLNKPATSDVTIVPDATLPGAFSPPSVTLPAGFQTAVMTFVPTQRGAGVISCTNGAGLANPTPSPITCFGVAKGQLAKYGIR